MTIKDDRASAIFFSYIRDKKILIADKTFTSRTSVAANLAKLGAMTSNVDMVSNFVEAEELLKKKKHHVVICDYDLGGRCGLDLLQTLREVHPELKESLFILITGHASQAAISQAAEEDVDSFILKPFSSLMLREKIIKTAANKMRPNEYRMKIDKGKELMLSGQLDAAIECFNEAKQLDPQPALAHFYHGQAQFMKEQLGNAEKDYKKGLDLNHIHYKCMVGLFELFMKRKMYADAYDVVRRIARYFPANPKRLAQVLRLAIQTNNFADIEGYYKMFIELDARNPELTKHMCAALVVCGKYYLGRKNTGRALEIFQKAAATGNQQYRVLREIIVTLCEFEMYEKAGPYFDKFPKETHSQQDYSVADFMMTSHNAKPHELVKDALALIEKGWADPVIYKTLIVKLKKGGMTDEMQRYYDEAMKRWPDLGEEFARVRQELRLH